MTLKREDVVPHLKEGKKVDLYMSEGKVYTIAKFINKFKSKVDNKEKKILNEQIELFEKRIPSYLLNPLTRSSWLNKGNKKIIVNRGGARSAFWEKEKLKLKGCRPIKDLRFPIEYLEFGSTEMVSGEINFGTMSIEGVLSEILAYCFFRKFSIPINQTPVAVFEYTSKGKIIGYCIVVRTPRDARLEKDLDYFGLSVKDLIKIKHLEKKFKIRFLNGEVGFKGVNQEWYSKSKSDLLLRMNFKGGFRGILNSNIGNDLEYNGQLFITDFDTFNVVDIPKKPSQKFLNNFVLWCVVEVLKTCPTVWDYIDLEDEKEAVELLTNSFYENSQLWKCYNKGFMQNVNKLNWNKEKVNKAFEFVKKSKIYYEMILDVVPNSKLIKETYSPELSFYMPHA